VKPGEIVGFLGRNGAGKTTTMNIITGYISSTAGSVTVDGYDVLRKPLEVKRRIGYLPEHPPLYLDMTVWDYLNFSADLKKVPRRGRAAALNEICERVKITDMRKRMIKNLSKGYRQRVGIAQALVGAPQTLILDEPTVGLDPRQIIEIRNLIRDLGQDRTLILSSHILQEVSHVCERVVIIDGGRIVAADTLEKLLGGAGERRVLTARAAGPEKGVLQVVKGITGVRDATVLNPVEAECAEIEITLAPGADPRKNISTALHRAGYPIVMLKPQETTLEDIFLRLTEGKR